MKIVVIDDDPTGSQTVHSCPLLLCWDQAALRKGLGHPSPLLFVLANTRALTPEAAAFRNREIVDALVLAMAAEGLQEHELLLVSRGDSTLRGHGVLEPQVLAQAWEEHFAAVDATLHVPAFFEGGRTTENGVHLLHGEPVHTTAFAQDRLFGYGTSDLTEWLEEKSAGQIAADAVVRIPLALLEAERAEDLLACLEALDANKSVVVDATHPEHLRALGVAIRRLQGRKRFLFRSAASLLNGLVDSGPSPLGPQPLDASGLVGLRRRDPLGQPLPGLVVVGSHVALADQQLKDLLANARCRGIELPVARIARVLEGGSSDWLLPDLEAEWRSQLELALEEGLTPVLFTSRGELSFGAGAAAARRLRFGMELASLMARLLAGVAPRLGYLISKGGITTGTLLVEGLGLEAVQLEGQLLPGLSLVRPITGPSDSLPVITFPGNLGKSDTLTEAWRWFEEH
ncbi:putative sugar and nucleotide-binding domains containing protein [Synechococcus sp. SYN20]|uniref:four-carbon acid sugar kinase family protein n=1 Tax=Synechococcus sp. SYN20 TaxID=1050714 RepID=UPI0016481967|nr:four-carbon acid sugar kinase family protein [Synechococcus sp. SYN20]QNJ24632.1 putative sugar and nucleotide-binding domains containing protein [Synechococcus sp. SYN20]